MSSIGFTTNTLAWVWNACKDQKIFKGLIFVNSRSATFRGFSFFANMCKHASTMYVHVIYTSIAFCGFKFHTVVNTNTTKIGPLENLQLYRYIPLFLHYKYSQIVHTMAMHMASG